MAEPAIYPSAFKDSFLCLRIALNFSRLVMFGFPKFLLFTFFILYNTDIKNEIVEHDFDQDYDVFKNLVCDKIFYKILNLRFYQIRSTMN